MQSSSYSQSASNRNHARGSSSCDAKPRSRALGSFFTVLLIDAPIKQSAQTTELPHHLLRSHSRVKPRAVSHTIRARTRSRKQLAQKSDRREYPAENIFRYSVYRTHLSLLQKLHACGVLFVPLFVRCTKHVARVACCTRGEEVACCCRTEPSPLFLFLHALTRIYTYCSVQIRNWPCVHSYIGICGDCISALGLKSLSKYKLSCAVLRWLCVYIPRI